MRVQLGTIAVDGGLHKEAADHFLAAVKAGASFATLDIHSMHIEFVLVRCYASQHSFYKCSNARLGSCSAGTSSLCGKSRTSNGAVRYFGLVNLDQPLRRTDT